MDPQRRPLWSPFFNAECAVAAHSRPTLYIAVSDSDNLEIAKVALARIREAFPAIEVVTDASAPVELSVNLPVQAGLKHHINLNLQNVDELHFSVGAFWLEWFPCTDSAKVDAFVNAVVGFISGRLRVLEHYRGVRCIKAELQEPIQDGWHNIGVWSTLHFPFPWQTVQRVISNA